MPRQPNIVLIVTDDAGYGDFEFQGSKIMETKHLSDLAEQSVRFDQAYVSDPTCGPSRAGLLTGRYQQRFGYEENNVPGYMSLNSKLVGDEMGLPLTETTMADRLKAIGYHTALFGKWHQGNADRYHPLKRGFDEFYGFRGGARSYFPYGPDNPLTQPENRMERGFGFFKEFDGYLTDVLADEATDYIKRNRDRPFFAMVSFTAVHTPLEPLPSDLAQFPHLKGDRQKAAALMLSLDRAIGRILAALASNGLTDDTLIVFVNDNGGETPNNAANNYPLAGTKSTHLEGGIRVPMLMRWPAQLKGGTDYHYPVITLDLLPTFLDAANRQNPDDEAVFDGVSLLPYLSGENADRPHRDLYWKRGARLSMREMEWKLIRHPDRPAELFDIERDPAEQNDLAADEPEILRSMFRKLFAWETSLERPLWMLRPQYDRQDMEWMDEYRVPRETIEQ